MSFCGKCKEELLSVRLSHCCQSAYVYGLLLFGRSFSIQRIALQTGNPEVAQGYCDALQSAYGVSATVKQGGSLRPTYVAEVESESDRLKILASYDFGMTEEYIENDLFVRDCCFASFLRGAFLACGNINDPEKEYRLEWNIKKEKIALELQALLWQRGIGVTLSSRSSGFQLYTKDSTTVEEILALMGASRSAMELMDTKIIKEVKNNMNRARNCDGWNISKTVEASIRQRQAIAKLERLDRLESLPQELLEAAYLREKNPDASLKELCKLSKESLSLSGLNHRLNKIVSLADNIEE